MGPIAALSTHQWCTLSAEAEAEVDAYAHLQLTAAALVALLLFASELSTRDEGRRQHKDATNQGGD
jgi:hypothetical protein